ncbi:MAG: hypothetical protein KDB05_21565, partial [Planctomycetales bacterium]|nr:hypothetical protein [Planctomycetales bacterium]
SSGFAKSTNPQSLNPAPTMVPVNGHGCGPVQVSSDVTPDNTGEDSSEEDNTGGLAATEEDE